MSVCVLRRRKQRRHTHRKLSRMPGGGIVDKNSSEDEDDNDNDRDPGSSNRTEQGFPSWSLRLDHTYLKWSWFKLLAYSQNPRGESVGCLVLFPTSIGTDPGTADDGSQLEQTFSKPGRRYDKTPEELQSEMPFVRRGQRLSTDGHPFQIAKVVLRRTSEIVTAPRRRSYIYRLSGVKCTSRPFPQQFRGKCSLGAARRADGKTLLRNKNPARDTKKYKLCRCDLAADTVVVMQVRPRRSSGLMTGTVETRLEDWKQGWLRREASGGSLGGGSCGHLGNRSILG